MACQTVRQRCQLNMRGLCRALKGRMEHLIGKQIDLKSLVLGWLIEHVGVLYILFSFDERAKDGLTPFRKIRGRNGTVPLTSFGEHVDFRVRTQPKLAVCWESGASLGDRFRTPDHWYT